MRFVNRVWSGAVAMAMVSFGCAHPSPSARTAPEIKEGILVMAHGGSDEWNRAVQNVVAPLQAQAPTALALGMANPVTLQAAVDTLEGLGVQRIVVVRLFISGRSFLERTEYVLGLRPDLPGTDTPPARVRRTSRVTLSEGGLVDSPLAGSILADRVRGLSTSPGNEAILILAHGMGPEADNDRLLVRLDALADSVRQLASFASVRVATLREDWQAERAVSEKEIRRFVAKHSEHGRRVIVIPFRLAGFGPYREVLDGLDYISDGMGLVPHAKITEWIRTQVSRR